MHFTQAMNTVHLHVRTCRCAPFFLISETAGRIVLKFGVWLETHYLGVLQKSRVAYNNTCRRAHPFSVYRERLDGLH